MDEKQRLINSLTYKSQAATWPFAAVTTTLVFLRYFTHFYINKSPLDWDDVLIFVSWVLALTRESFYQAGLTAVRHIKLDDIPATIPRAAFWVFFAEHWSFMSVSIPKCAIGILLVRLFEPRYWLKMTITVLCVGISVLGVIGFFISTLDCRPVAAQWNPYRYPNGHCWSQDTLDIYTGVFGGISAFIDLAFAIYPGYIIWNLKLSRWQRLSTTLLMGLGSASATFAIIKLVVVERLKGNPDMYARMHNGILVSLWCSFENDLILSTACLPYSRPFYRACRTWLSTNLESYRERKYLKRTSMKLEDASTRSNSVL